MKIYLQVPIIQHVQNIMTTLYSQPFYIRALSHYKKAYVIRGELIYLTYHSELVVIHYYPEQGNISSRSK